MANLRTAMDAAFWDLNISTPQSLDGVARSIPGEPIPLDGSRASRALRIQQVDILRNGFPLGIIPTWSPTPHKELGSFALHSLLFRTCTHNWWLGLIGQFRPKKLISSLKAELSAGDEWEIPAFKDVARHFLDKSLYSIGLCSQLALTSSTSLVLSLEKHGERKGRKSRAMVYHKLPGHDITFEAAWPELFIDSKGKYWEVPESMSLDCLSLVSDSGLRYRFGLHKNNGVPKTINSSVTEAPLALLPGFCAKAAFSYEKSKDLWRQKETKEDLIVETPAGKFFRPSYDIRLKEPHAAISGIIGAACASWFGSGKSTLSADSSEAGDDHIHLNAKRRSPFSVDLFASGCYTFQHGKFRKYFGDLTRIDTRLDVPSASVLLKQFSNMFSNTANRNPQDVVSSPRINLIFQQQVVGPIVFRLDSRLLLDSPSGRRGPHLEDIVFSLNYSLRLLHSGKVVAWYSPQRKEGMLELRLFEF